MATIKIERTVCDKCTKALRGSGALNIVTSLSEDRIWARLHVKVEHNTGGHSNDETRNADLCQDCTISLLKDALKRATKGERVSSGIDDVEISGW